MALNKDSFEFQVCMLMLVAAGADEDVSEEELGAIVGSLNELFHLLKKSANAQTYLESVLKAVGSMPEAELEERVGFAMNSLKVNLDGEQLGIVYDNIRAIAQADGMGPKEAEFLAALKKAWE